MNKRCVLMAEDDDTQRELFTFMLATAGFDVRPVATGKAALAELKRCQPDVILTDIMMPDMDGLELVRLVKEKAQFAHIPIVVMTAFGKGYLSQAWAIGAQATLPKPFEPEDLFMAIMQVLPDTPGQ